MDLRRQELKKIGSFCDVYKERLSSQFSSSDKTTLLSDHPKIGYAKLSTTEIKIYQKGVLIVYILSVETGNPPTLPCSKNVGNCEHVTIHCPLNPLSDIEKFAIQKKRCSYTDEQEGSNKMRNSKYVNSYFNVGLEIQVKENSDRERDRTKKRNRPQNLTYELWKHRKERTKKTARRKSSIKKLETNFQTRRTTLDIFKTVQ